MPAVQELDGNVLPLSAWLADATKHGRRRRWDLLGKDSFHSAPAASWPMRLKINHSIEALRRLVGLKLLLISRWIYYWNLSVEHSLPPPLWLMASNQFKRNLSIQLAIWIHLNWSPFLANTELSRIFPRPPVKYLILRGRALVAILVAHKEHSGGVWAPGWWRQLPEEVIAPPHGGAPTPTRWPLPS